MAIRKSQQERVPRDDTPLLIAALEHSWAWYDARMNRGLQVVNYFLVAIAVLATAYVSAFNARHYAVAAVIALAGAALTGATIMTGYRQRRTAAVGELALVELQDRLASVLGVDAIRMQGPGPSKVARYASVWIAFGLAVLLSGAAAVYALLQ